MLEDIDVKVCGSCFKEDDSSGASVLQLLIASNVVSVVCGFIVCVQDLMVMVTAVLTCVKFVILYIRML